MLTSQRREAFKMRLRQRQSVFAAWSSIGHPQITEILAKSGVDCLGIDIEHSTISQEQSQRIIGACHAEGVVCLPRIATHNEEMIKRLLDSGADGLIVPTVSTPEQVERLATWMRYPPLGRRGFGIARAQGYGFDFTPYTSTWNQSASLIIQIETLEGVNNIDALLAHDAVDAAMVGPYDLSGSLGIPGQIDHPRVAEAAQKVVEACRRLGKGCGTQVVEPNGERIADIFTRGFTFGVMASDVFTLWKWSERLRGDISAFRGNGG